ncbi:hypothetical protein [Rugosimonospora africana]|uniref:Uncharacterized protein n=1 Tax=Rugosimonospora africana TaxID=556532 RepID=A0A8J3VRY5_9ACTN|nr:hypothetical protein [Rugosimonospora africana]GIH15971.1 hypothetical protein Raf01_41430 [Rugosimonospora africana]
MNTPTDADRPAQGRPAPIPSPEPAPPHLPTAPRVGPTFCAWWLLRLWVTLQALDAFLQPVFEGRFLSGDYAMLSLHRTNATYVGVLSVSLPVVAVVAWRVSQVPGRIVLGMAALAPLAALQIVLGFSRTLGIHVPLGVAILGLSGWLTVWMWTHHPAGKRMATTPGQR